MKKQSGITLIALVITIIVLLILAAVSISLTLGNNGILSQASNAVIANKEAQAKEELAMAWSSSITKYWGDWANDATVNKSNYLTKAVLDQYLPNGTLVEDPTYSNGVYTAKYLSNGQVYTVKFDEQGNATVTKVTKELVGTTASEVAANPATYFEKTVKYSVLGLSDWKIFYADEDNIFLVAADYLPNQYVKSSTGMYRTGTYVAYWNNAPYTQPVNAALKDSFLYAGYSNYGYANGRCTSSLLNTANWTDFVNSTFADYAIGAPTLEMFVESWNKRYPSDKIYCNNTNEYGYCIGTTSDATTYYITLSSKEGYNNTIYFPRHEGIDLGNGDTCYAYWLASPSCHSFGSMMRVMPNGMVNVDGFSIQAYAARPLIRLKDTTTLTTGTDGYDYNLISNE